MHSRSNNSAGLLLAGQAGVAVRKELPAARANTAPSRRAGSVAPCLGLLLCALGFATDFADRAGAQPVVTNVTAAQLAPPSKLVAIYYAISDPVATSVNISILVSKDSGATWTVPASTFPPPSTYGPNVSVTPTLTTNLMFWNAGADWDGHYTTNCRVRVLANDAGLMFIPGGMFSMGDANDGNAVGDAPLHQVTITSAYYMDSTLVTGGHWNLVVEFYAQFHGYDIAVAQQQGASGPAFKFDNYPIEQITWYDAVKWCNARSEFEGLMPVYYTDGTKTTVYRSGTIDLATNYVKWTANGYRLPTEAEWEKAARGGLSGLRFPWGNIITETNANYSDTGGEPYDHLGTQTYATGAQPYTSPVGSFAANGYGLYDMAGNVEEWCWDWYGISYYAGGQTDPQGPSGGYRVLRGGNWNDYASYARCAFRYSLNPNSAFSDIGFRCVRGL